MSRIVLALLCMMHTTLSASAFSHVQPLNRGGRGPAGGTTVLRKCSRARPLGALHLKGTKAGQDDADMKAGLDKEFVGISAPAFVQFAAEPLASLVDTMYLGRLGATALGGDSLLVLLLLAHDQCLDDRDI